MAGRAGFFLGSIYNKRQDRNQYLHRRPSQCPDYASYYMRTDNNKKGRSLSVPAEQSPILYSCTEAPTSHHSKDSPKKKQRVMFQNQHSRSPALSRIRRHSVAVVNSAIEIQKQKARRRQSHVTQPERYLIDLKEESLGKKHKLGKTRRFQGAGGGLLRAAKAGNLDRVVHLLDNENIDISTSNSNGLTALLLATKEKHYDVVDALFERGASPDQATKLGNTGLHIACLAGNLPMVKLFIKKGAELNPLARNSFTPLYMAAQEGHAAVVDYLIKHGADHNLATEDGFTPLAVALQEGRDAVVNLLLSKNGQEHVRLPPLHLAAKKDNVEFATLLLQPSQPGDVRDKANVNQTSESGFTALHVAAHYGHVNIADVLLKHGASIDFKAKNGITSLHVAAKRGHADFCAFLLGRNARPDVCTRDQLTPLHCAARSGHSPVVKLLLNTKQAPKFARTKNGLSVLHMAVQGGHLDVIELLLDNGYSIEDVTSDYLSPLHIASHCGHVDVVQLLLDRGADVNSTALNGFSPLHVACKKEHADVAELLLTNGADKEALTESHLTPLHISAFVGNLQLVELLFANNVAPNLLNVRHETPYDMAVRAGKSDVAAYLSRHTANGDVPTHLNSITIVDVTQKTPS